MHNLITDTGYNCRYLLALPLITIIFMSTSPGRLDNLRSLCFLFTQPTFPFLFLGFWWFGMVWAQKGANNFSNARELKQVQCGWVVRGTGCDVTQKKMKTGLWETWALLLKYLVKTSFKGVRKSLESLRKCGVLNFAFMKIIAASGWCAKDKMVIMKLLA